MGARLCRCREWDQPSATVIVAVGFCEALTQDRSTTVDVLLRVCAALRHNDNVFVVVPDDTPCDSSHTD